MIVDVNDNIPWNPCGSTANDTPPLIWDCSTVTNQRWTVAGKAVQILGKSLDAPIGARVAPWDCDGGTGRQWTRQPDGNPAEGPITPSIAYTVVLYARDTASGAGHTVRNVSHILASEGVSSESELDSGTMFRLRSWAWKALCTTVSTALSPLSSWTTERSTHCRCGCLPN
jgi:hypothetical protein